MVRCRHFRLMNTAKVQIYEPCLFEQRKPDISVENWPTRQEKQCTNLQRLANDKESSLLSFCVTNAIPLPCYRAHLIRILSTSQPSYPISRRNIVASPYYRASSEVVNEH